VALGHFLWQEVCAILYFFLHIFSEKKTRDMKLWLIFIYLCAQFVETVCIYEFLLEKTLFVKTNSLKWSQGSQDIDILKSAFFRVFSNDNEEIYFIYVGGKNR
jgi:hypothetical protein